LELGITEVWELHQNLELICELMITGVWELHKTLELSGNLGL